MCDYLVLTKPAKSNIDCDENNEIYCFSGNVYILPNNYHYYSNNGLSEKSLIEMVKEFCFPDKNILDIGAHTGTYSISLAHYSKHVYAFEPQKMTYYSLCGGVALSAIKNITCINCALGSFEQEGKQLLHINSLDGGGSSLHYNAHIMEDEEIEVRTLDSFNISNISFIKIDVEDNELQVLMNGVNTLKLSNYPKILFEMNTINSALLDFLVALNYGVQQVNGYSNMYLATFIS
jgi:FkbM family methyltransferase